MRRSLSVLTRSDRAQMATRISQAITGEEPLHGKLVRVVRRARVKQTSTDARMRSQLQDGTIRVLHSSMS